MSVVPEGTLDLTQTSEEIEVPAQNQIDEIEALERSVLEFYADRNDVLEDDYDDNDDNEDDEEY